MSFKDKQKRWSMALKRILNTTVEILPSLQRARLLVLMETDYRRWNQSNKTGVLLCRGLYPIPSIDHVHICFTHVIMFHVLQMNEQPEPPKIARRSSKSWEPRWTRRERSGLRKSGRSLPSEC